jgi:hypothetical protein
MDIQVIEQDKTFKTEKVLAVCESEEDAQRVAEGMALWAERYRETGLSYIVRQGKRTVFRA